MTEIISVCVWKGQKMICNLKRKGKKLKWGYQNRGKMYRYIRIKSR